MFWWREDDKQRREIEEYNRRCTLCKLAPGTPHLHTYELSPHLWIVPSATRPGVRYYTYITREHWGCACPAGSDNSARPMCWHAQLVDLFDGQRVDLDLMEELPGVEEYTLRYLRAAYGDEETQYDILKIHREQAFIEGNLREQNRINNLIQKWITAREVQLRDRAA